jgi:spermidine/putrescine transport system permease protein
VNAWVLERTEFRGKTFLAMMMLWPLVIPGVVLGISILAFFSRLANGLEDWLQTDLDFLRPGLSLVILGQLSFILTIATLIIAARLRKFDRSLEEAAFDLGASRARVLRTVTLPFLRPALIGAGLVALLMSFENFNTTLMLVGSDAPLPITMYGQMREGATPAINAVSLLLMLGVGGIASVFALTSKAER